jgi:hypothetical protein
MAMLRLQSLNSTVLIASILALFLSLGCSKSEQAWCVDYARTSCEKGQECGVPVGLLAGGNCDLYAEALCAEDYEDGDYDDGDESCGDVPSDAQLQECLDDINGMSCTQVINLQEPASCTALEMVCESQGDDNDPNPPTGDDAPTGNQDPNDVYNPGQDQNTCPYTVANLNCKATCNQLWGQANTCASDPSLPASLQALLATMSMTNETMAKMACESKCNVDKAYNSAQWECFQGAPTNTCTGIAQCTANACY